MKARAPNTNDSQSKTLVEEGKSNLNEGLTKEKKKKKNKLNALSQVLKQEAKKVVSECRVIIHDSMKISRWT